MVKDDERALLAIMQDRNPQDIYPRQIVRDLGMDEKRGAYILEKWAGQGRYDYGVSVMAGWLTPKGLEQ
jgi:hypothetical protein